MPLVILEVERYVVISLLKRKIAMNYCSCLLFWCQINNNYLLYTILDLLLLQSLIQAIVKTEDLKLY